MSVFLLISLVGWAAVVGLALLRSRAYAIFRGVTLGLQVLFAATLAYRFQSPPWLFWAFCYLHGAVFVQALGLIRPRMRSLPYRALVSVPGSFFAAGTLLALPWVLAKAAGFELPGVFLPYAAAGIGVLQSLWSREEARDIVVADAEVVPALTRHRAGSARVKRPLRLVQITDPHLGPFMSVQRLAAICQRAVDKDPDIIVLTGDFLTMESQADPELLERALAPLSRLPGQVFACFGNHDHEAPHVVRRALSSNGITLLMDDATTIQTGAGLVQIVGMDFVWRERKAHLARVCAEHPRVDGALRIVLLHDPGAFQHLPEGEADLVLSGHTHGGQVGLVSLGLPHTMMRAFVKMPDHGLWARGTDRLYVHRGTGHYGFPLRLGVPAEESVLVVHSPAHHGEPQPS
ncbi:MAG: phosphodiesterase [Polyangiaceae bacterium]|jgi:predicted MPP superfamily phosphohydrolase|nr:phosphodiesterase [Polyangiaceae bacterium]